MKKALALILAVVMCVALFAACAGNESSSNSTAASGSSSGATTTAASGTVDITKAELSVVTMFGGADAHTALYKGINANFSSLTGVKISDSSQKSDGTWQTKVINDFGANNIPDVLFFFNAAQGQQLVDTGKLVDVQTIRDAYPDYAKNISDGVLKAPANTMSDGKNYCVPIKGFAEGIFCNKLLFAEAGVSTDDLKTWDGFLTAIDKFKAKNIVPISASVGDQPHYFYEYLMLAATGPADYSKTISSAADVPATFGTGLDLFKVLEDKKAFQSDTYSIKGDNAPDLFMQGKAAMYVDGSWHAGAYSAKPTEASEVKADVLYTDDMDFIAFPACEGKEQAVISGYSTGWYITTAAWEDATKREAAVKYVMTQISDASISMYCGPGLGGIPASTTAEMPEALGTLFKAISEIVPNYTNVFPTQDNLKASAQAIWKSDCAKVAKGTMSGADLIKAVYEEQFK